MTPAFFYPVESRLGGPVMPHGETVAIFFDASSATDFINAEHPERYLYLGEPRRDRRDSGYRAAPKHTFDYEAWCAEVDAKRAQLTECHGDPLLGRAA